MFGLFKKKSDLGAVPSTHAEPERYVGRPLLIILENYVLSCIGHLAPDVDARMSQIVDRMWPGPGDWEQRIRTRLKVTDEMDQNIRDLWAKNTDLAKQKGVQLHPVQFAKMIADTNFAPLIDP